MSSHGHSITVESVIVSVESVIVSVESVIVVPAIDCHKTIWRIPTSGTSEHPFKKQSGKPKNEALIPPNGGRLVASAACLGEV
jgi:hypothetical protein